jgi:AcrR family transcriptional regulator
MIVAPYSIKPMATLEGQARNETILRTAAQLMVQKGYGATSIADIAQAVGMTKAGLYHHIKSKQDMLFQVLSHAMNVLQQVVIAPTQAMPDPEDRLRQIVRLHVQGLFDHGLEVPLLFPERRHLEPEQRRVINEQIQGYLTLLQTTLQELAGQGKLRDLDTRVGASHILQTIAGIARWYAQDSGITVEHLVEETVHYNLSAVLKTA